MDTCSEMQDQARAAVGAQLAWHANNEDDSRHFHRAFDRMQPLVNLSSDILVRYAKCSLGELYLHNSSYTPLICGGADKVIRIAM